MVLTVTPTILSASLASSKSKLVKIQCLQDLALTGNKLMKKHLECPCCMMVQIYHEDDDENKSGTFMEDHNKNSSAPSSMTDKFKQKYNTMQAGILRI